MYVRVIVDKSVEKVICECYLTIIDYFLQFLGQTRLFTKI